MADLIKQKKESVNLKIVIGNHPVRGARKKKKWESLRVLWNNNNRINICIVGVPEGEGRERERERESESLFKKKKLNLDWKLHKSGEGNGHLDPESIKDYNKMN